MNFRREPMLTLSPQQPCSVGSQVTTQRDGTLQTTPTLPRRERLASFSRLLRSKNFKELITEKPIGSRSPVKLCQSLTFEDKCMPESAVSIYVSPSSPTEEFSLNESKNGYLCTNQLPFSPTFLSNRTPVCMSPCSTQPTPVKSPLYVPDDKGIFLGRGSFGNVILCRFKDSKFALKILHSASNVGEKNLLGIRHPFLAEIFCISTVQNKTLIFMEFAGNCNLQYILDAKSELDFRRRLSFCLQIASGLRHCHKNSIAHGDVKPANVIVNPYGICKLCDFGHSIKLDEESSGKATMVREDVIGTVVYAAPEILRGSRPSTLSDIYSFGILLWQVKTREMPFSGEHPHVVIYKVVHYGSRPKFQDCNSKEMTQYAELAEMCWSNDPSCRIDADHLLSYLQNIMQMIKGNVSKAS